MSRLVLSSSKRLLSSISSSSILPLQNRFINNKVASSLLISSRSFSYLTQKRTIYAGQQLDINESIESDDKNNKFLDYLSRIEKYSFASYQVPITFVLVPDMEENNKDSEHPMDHYRLHFFCPITRKIVHCGPEAKGFKVHLTSEEVSHFLPYLQFGYHILKLLPVNALNQGISAIHQFYERDEDNDVVIIDYAGKKFKPFSSSSSLQREDQLNTEVYEKYIDNFLDKLKKISLNDHEFVHNFLKEKILDKDIGYSGLQLFNNVWVSDEGINKILLAKKNINGIY